MFLEMIIATRIMKLIGDNGDIELPIHLHAPSEDDRCWRCDYEIGWPRNPHRASAYGVDGVQALQLAMSAIGTDLQLSPYHRAGLLIFEETDPGYGFPAGLPPDAGRMQEHRAD